MDDEDEGDDDSPDVVPEIDDDDEQMQCSYCPPGCWFWASEGRCSRCLRPPWGCDYAPDAN